MVAKIISLEIVHTIMTTKRAINKTRIKTQEDVIQEEGSCILCYVWLQFSSSDNDNEYDDKTLMHIHNFSLAFGTMTWLASHSRY